MRRNVRARNRVISIARMTLIQRYLF